MTAGRRATATGAARLAASPTHPTRSAGTFARISGTLAHGRGFLKGPLPWFALLFASICLEGLGRKFLRDLPMTVFYLAKDAVLLGGLAWFGINRRVLHTVRTLYGLFVIPLVLAMLWTLGEFLNPQVPSFSLSLLGLRAYWLWWLAPIVIASALHRVHDYRYAMALIALFALGITAFAAYQFVLPADDPMNTYAFWHEAREAAEPGVATVAATGRVRVSSTFSFLTGFTAFVALIGPLLIALGVGHGRGPTRAVCLAGGVACMATAPMSGSRTPIIMSIVALVLVALGAGVFKARGRWIPVAGLLALVALFFAAPEAVAGVQSRFENTSETNTRLWHGLDVVPPVALSIYEYPLLGLGTGTMQNARVALRLPNPRYLEEYEAGRYLVELGPVGYLLYWLARLGIAVALVRAGLRLRRGGRGAPAGAAYALAALSLYGYQVFDHVWQALLFFSVGFVLYEASTLPAPPPRARSTRRTALPTASQTRRA